jgi:asparagine synthase (glutamine-hydrolysing)
MQEASNQPVRTFSIGFHEDGYNEARHAAAVAAHLGTDHTELYVTPDEARDVIPRLPEIYDEPFADSSQIPTFLVSEMTRRHVTVALSGDGGDELFCGYTRYFHANMLQPQFERAPRMLRRMAALALAPIPGRTWDMAALLMPSRWRPVSAGHKVRRLTELLQDDGDALYLQLLSHWHDPEALLGEPEPDTIITNPGLKRIVGDYTARLQYIDTLTYLPDDILAKVDRASMAVALEVRVPMIDHRVVELSWRMPRHMHVREGKGKWLLRQLLDRYVPSALVDRPKMGFGVPIDHWLRGPLRDWAETWLSEKALSRTGFDPALIRERWARHLNGSENWQYPLWTIITLQAWMEHHA